MSVGIGKKSNEYAAQIYDVHPEEKFTKNPCPTCGTPHAVINGFWLAAVRKRAGESQRQLAFRLGYAPAYLCDIERNRRNCPKEIREAYERLAQ
jgi:ribosomal protein S14